MIGPEDHDQSDDLVMALRYAALLIAAMIGGGLLGWLRFFTRGG